jgi:hypothetical protein
MDPSYVAFVPAIIITVTLTCEEIGNLGHWLLPSKRWIPAFTLTGQAEAGMA